MDSGNLLQIEDVAVSSDFVVAGNHFKIHSVRVPDGPDLNASNSESGHDQYEDTFRH